MPDYLDLEAWGCDEDSKPLGKPCIEDLIASMVKWPAPHMRYIAKALPSLLQWELCNLCAHAIASMESLQNGKPCGSMLEAANHLTATR